VRKKTVPPGINIIGVTPKVYAILKEINMTLAHASEAGITLYVPMIYKKITKAVSAERLAIDILHETNTYLTGGLHVESLAVEIVDEFLRKDKPINAIPNLDSAEEAFQDKIKADPRAAKELRTYYAANRQTLSAVLASRNEKINKIEGFNRPIDLLSTMNQAKRDIATTDRFNIRPSDDIGIQDPDILKQDEKRLETLLSTHAETFGPAAAAQVVARGNGRINIIGNHTDHDKDTPPNNVAMPMAIGLNTLVAASTNGDRMLRFKALNFGTDYEISIVNLIAMGERLEAETKNKDGQSPSAETFREVMTPTDKEKREATKENRSYVPMFLGFFWEAYKAGYELRGADFTIEGNNPIGGGTSASAGTMVALTLAAHDVFRWKDQGFDINDKSLWANVARNGEVNVFAGRVVGLLDQLASIFGKKGKAVNANFSKLSEAQTVDVDFGDFKILSVNSTLKHDLAAGDSSYKRLHDEYVNKVPPFLKQLAEAAGLDIVVPQGQEFAHASDYTYSEFQELTDYYKSRKGQQRFNTATDDNDTLFLRARHIINERERGLRIATLMEEIIDFKRNQGKANDDFEVETRIIEVANIINESGNDFANDGDIAMAGMHKVPKHSENLKPAMDWLRQSLFAAGARAVAGRGGGDGGAYFVMIHKDKKDAMIEATKKSYLDMTGIQLEDKDFIDANPADGSRIVYRQKTIGLSNDVAQSIRRINSKERGKYKITTAIRQGKTLIEFAETGSDASFTIMPGRGGKIVSHTLTNNQEVLNQTEDLDGLGGIPIMGPWANRWEKELKLVGMKRDGNGIPIHGTINGNEIEIENIWESDDGINVKLSYDTKKHKDVQEAGFKHLKIEWTIRLDGNDLEIEAVEYNYAAEPVLSQVGFHPYITISADAYFEQADVDQIIGTNERLIPNGTFIDRSDKPKLDIADASRRKRISELNLDTGYTINRKDGRDKSITVVDPALRRKTTVTAIAPPADEPDGGFDTFVVWNGGEETFGKKNLVLETQRLRLDAMNQQKEQARLEGNSTRVSKVLYHHEILPAEATNRMQTLTAMMDSRRREEARDQVSDPTDDSFPSALVDLVAQAAFTDGDPGLLVDPSSDTPEDEADLGGIDLNPALYELVIKRDDNGVPLPVHQQPIKNIQMKIDGFTPVIIHVEPAYNLPTILGLNDEEEAYPYKQAAWNTIPGLDPMDKRKV